MPQKQNKKLRPDELKRRLATLYKELDDCRDKNAKAIQALKLRCPHKWEYHYDPSGGSDSGYYCHLCRAWTSSKPKETQDGQ